MRRLMLWFSSHPILTLTLISGISIGALFPASRVQIGSSVESLMMKDDPERDYYFETRDLFGSEATAIIYVEDSDLFSPKKLSALRELVFALEDLEHVSAVDSLYSVTDIFSQNDLLNIQPLIGWPPETKLEANQIKQRAITHPLLNRLMLSDKADATLINIRLDLQNKQTSVLRALSRRIDDITAPHAKNFQVLNQLGRPYVINQQAIYIQRDQKTMLPLATAVLLTMLVCILASLKGAILPLLTSGISILWTFAFMGLFDLPITILSFMVPSLIIVIGSTEDIHLLAEYKTGRINGLKRKPAVERMIMRLAIAVLFTALTTVSGFISIISSPMPILREFGIVASFGLLVNPLITISLIPACLTLFPDHTNRSRRQQNGLPYEEAILRILAKLRRHPKITLPVIILPCVAAGIYGAIHIQPDNNIMRYFKPDAPIVQRADRLHEKLCGPETFCIRIDAATPNSFKNPDNLNYAIKLQQYLEDEGWTDRSISLTDYLTYVHQSFSSSEDPLPDSAQSVAEYLLLLHHNEIEPYVTSSFQNLNIIVRHNIRSSQDLLSKLAALRNYIQETCPPELNANVTGEMLLVHKSVGAIVRGQLRGILMIAVIAAVLLSLLFRNIRIGCIGLIPNLLPIGIQFGIMAATGIPLNTATSMAAAIGIGLAVDDTIHLLMHFYSQDEGLNPEEAVALSVRHVIKPVIATSLSLSMGFLVMRFSQFVPIGDFALLAAVVLFAALIADLIVTPTLLSINMMHPPSRHPKPVEPSQ